MQAGRSQFSDSREAGEDGGVGVLSQVIDRGDFQLVDGDAGRVGLVEVVGAEDRAQPLGLGVDAALPAGAGEDRAVAPVLVVAGHAHDQARDVAVSAGPSGACSPRLFRPPSPDQLAVPAQDRTRSHQALKSAVPSARDEREQRGHERPVGPRQAYPARLLSLEHGHLVTQ
jgi:hypothetical protein